VSTWERTQLQERMPATLHNELVVLCKRNHLLDRLTIYATWGAFIAGLLLSSKYPVLIIVQGFLIHQIGGLTHDFYVHGRALPYFGAFLGGALTSLSPTHYKSRHHDHHTALPNSESDPDRAVNIHPTLLQKLAAFTIFDRFLRPGRTKLWPSHTQYTEAELLRIRVEKISFFVVFGGVAASAATAGVNVFITGWLIPLLVVTPVITGLRVVLEHGLYRADDVLYQGTPAKVPSLIASSTFAPYYGIGHLLHHYFPALPWYNYRRALILLTPWVNAKMTTLTLYQACGRWLKDGR
jgi:fatty acid desaturase